MDLPGYRVFENLSCNVITTLASTFREGVYVFKSDRLNQES